MINVNFLPKTNEADVIIKYDDFIPFTIKIGTKDFLPETIYTRNIYRENFIEFRFEKESKKLYEITAVGIDFMNVIKTEKISATNSLPFLYECYFNDLNNNNFLFSEITHIYKDESSIQISWNDNIDDDINYYSISEQCIMGINSNNELSCIVINNIEKHILNSVFI